MLFTQSCPGTTLHIARGNISIVRASYTNFLFLFMAPSLVNTSGQNVVQLNYFICSPRQALSMYGLESQCMVWKVEGVCRPPPTCHHTLSIILIFTCIWLRTGDFIAFIMDVNDYPIYFEFFESVDQQNDTFLWVFVAPRHTHI